MILRKSLALLIAFAGPLGVAIAGCAAPEDDVGGASSNTTSGDAVDQYQSAVDALGHSACGQAPNLEALLAEHERLALAGTTKAFIDAISPISRALTEKVVPLQHDVLQATGILNNAARQSYFIYPMTRTMSSQNVSLWDGVTQSYWIVSGYPADYAAISKAGDVLRAERRRAETSCTPFLSSFLSVPGELKRHGTTDPMSDLRKLESDLSTDRLRYTYTRDALALIRSGGSVDADTFFALACGHEAACEADQRDMDGGRGNHLGSVVSNLRSTVSDATMALLESAIASTTQLIQQIGAMRAGVETAFRAQSGSWASFQAAYSKASDAHSCAYYRALEPTATRLETDIDRIDPGHLRLDFPRDYVSPAEVRKYASSYCSK